MSNPPVDAELAAARGLDGEEYARVCEVLGRTPTATELEITAALWSERCSRKSSKVHLQALHTHGPLVDIGHGWVAVLRAKSGRVGADAEPYAAGSAALGDVLREVFAMGARPIACLDALRFGAVDAPRMRCRVDGVVRGIGDSANCAGVPTVGGATGFHRGYDGGVLADVVALGLARRDRIVDAKAAGPGNPVLCAGRRTDRGRAPGGDRVVRPADPFAEKLLLEACLEVMRSDSVVAAKDLGAAGLAGAAFEMAARGSTGIRIDLGRVPQRRGDLAADEVLLSETQGRVLLVARRGRQEEVARVFERWSLGVAEIGEVTNDGLARLVSGRTEAGRLPIAPLEEGAPMYRRPVASPKDLAARQASPKAPPPDDPGAALEGLLATPELADKSWIWRQYDTTVRTNTVIGPGGDAAVLVLKGTPAGLALTCDVNPVYCGLDPATGGAQAVAEAVRNLACVGAEPEGLVDCLSFGNPEDPEIAWQFRECVSGMAAACKALDVPVISGDVSFSEGDGSLPPTPTVAMFGLIPDLVSLPRAHFTTEGDRVVLLGQDRMELGGSAYLRLLHGIEQGRPPEVHLGAEERLADLLRFLAFEGLLHTAHDLAEGGLAVALAEACVRGGLGIDLRLDYEPLGLFSETQARAIVAVAPGNVERVLEEAEELGVPAAEVGSVGGATLKARCDGAVLEAGVKRLREVWSTALPRALSL